MSVVGFHLIGSRNPRPLPTVRGIPGTGGLRCLSPLLPATLDPGKQGSYETSKRRIWLGITHRNDLEHILRSIAQL